VASFSSDGREKKPSTRIAEVPSLIRTFDTPANVVRTFRSGMLTA
jgi:hypothetical protein